MTGSHHMGEDSRDLDPSVVEEGETPTRCAVCGRRLDPGTWHPTVGDTDTDGTYRIVRFCSEDCHQTWNSDERNNRGN